MKRRRKKAGGKKVAFPKKKAPAPRMEPIIVRLRQALIEQDACPECLDPLCGQWFCPSCDYHLVEDREGE